MMAPVTQPTILQRLRALFGARQEMAPPARSAVIVITYGRSGSTLLQGILNAMPATYVAGENYNALYHLYETYQSYCDVAASHDSDGSEVSSHPYYGARSVDLDEYVRSCREMCFQLIVPKAKRAAVRRYGFKEVRYPDIAPSLPRFMDFLQRVFPDCRIVFNTRSLDQVAGSGWWAGEDRDAVVARLTAMDALFEAYRTAHPDVCYAIAYRDIVERTPALRGLFDFLGERYVEADVARVLNTLHSTRTDASQAAP